MTRRQAGEGTISRYVTRAGRVQYLIKVTVDTPDGTSKQVLRRRDADGHPFTTKKDAAEGIRALLARYSAPGAFVEPTKHTVGTYLAEWLDGLRLTPPTIASYRRTMRLHVTPYIGAVPLASLTGTRLAQHYRDLERASGLGARSIRYVGTIIGAALKAAVEDGLIPVNPAVQARKALPSAKAAKPAEMVVWTAEQVETFTRWAEAHADPEQLTGWRLLLATGMRRGELLALRWRDVDLDGAVISVRRSVGAVKVKGEKDRLVLGGTKTGKSRAVVIDADTVEMLRSYRAGRASAAFVLASADSLVFGNSEGEYRLPDSFSWYFTDCVRRCNLALAGGEGLRPVETLPALRMHGLRHTHATLLLGAGVHPKVVQERLGHSSVMVTMDIYSHVLPSMQQDAAAAIGRLLGRAAGE